MQEPFWKKKLIRKILCLISKISLSDNAGYIISNILAGILVQGLDVDGFSILDHNGGSADLWHMILKDGRGIDNGHRDYGDTALFCDLKASVMKRKEGIFGFIAGTLWKDADGNAVLD